MPLKGKVALVTGGTRGIGAAIVERFLGEGAKVYYTGRSVNGSDSKTRAVALTCDGRHKEEVDRAVEAVLAKEERIDILVNNAGVIRDGLFLVLSDEDWDEVLDTNFKGAVYFAKAVAKAMMIQREGRIINVSSIVGELGGFGQANYAASKGALNAFTKSLAAELASRGVTVNAVAPGIVNTEMSGNVRSLLGSKIQEMVPLKSFAEPKEIAAIVAFLAGADARYITGQIITIDGGLSLLSRR